LAIFCNQISENCLFSEQIYIARQKSLFNLVLGMKKDKKETWLNILPPSPLIQLRIILPHYDKG